MELIAHEMAHLSAFRQLAAEEGIAQEVCLQFGDTFDAAMTEEAWERLKGALQEMRKDHGDDHAIVKVCRLIEDADEAEEFTQMKGALGAVVHPAGQMSIPPFTSFLVPPRLTAYQMAIQVCARAVAYFTREG